MEEISITFKIKYTSIKHLYKEKRKTCAKTGRARNSVNPGSKAARNLANGKIPPFWNDRNSRQRTKWRVSRETVELGKSRGSVAFPIWDSSGRYSFCSSGVHSVERLRPRAQSVV